jgi:hypothetical protein
MLEGAMRGNRQATDNIDSLTRRLRMMMGTEVSQEINGGYVLARAPQIMQYLRLVLS